MDIPHVVSVADLHSGSSVALCPEVVKLDEGGTYRASPQQRWLHERWEEAWKWAASIIKHDRWGFEYNGDGVEGQHHGCIEPFSLNITTQAQVFMALLEPKIEKASWRGFVRGTESHDGKQCQALEWAARMLGANQIGGNYTNWLLNVDLGGYLVNYAHHIGTTTSAAYETSALNRELAAAFVEAGQWGEGRPDCLVRSHRHRYSSIEIPTSNDVARVVVTPAWQLHTPFSHKVAVNRRPQVGMVILSIEHGELVIRRKVWVPRNEISASLSKKKQSTGIVSLANLPKRTRAVSARPKSPTASSARKGGPACSSKRRSAKAK
jgi:hypothetical protein